MLVKMVLLKRREEEHLKISSKIEDFNGNSLLVVLLLNATLSITLLTQEFH